MVPSPDAPGSTSDKAVVAVNVDEKATGELSFGGGFSTDEGALLNAGKPFSKAAEGQRILLARVDDGYRERSAELRASAVGDHR